MKDKLNYKRKSYTITDYYLSYKEYIEEGTQYDVSYTTFRNIVSDYFKYIRDEVMLNNDHTNGFKYRFFWSKQDCIIPNRIKYMFVASRENKRDLAKLIFSKQCDYIEK